MSWLLDIDSWGVLCWVWQVCACILIPAFYILVGLCLYYVFWLLCAIDHSENRKSTKPSRFGLVGLPKKNWLVDILYQPISSIQLVFCPKLNWNRPWTSLMFTKPKKLLEQHQIIKHLFHLKLGSAKETSHPSQDTSKGSKI